jgi:hypothetical protein
LGALRQHNDGRGFIAFYLVDAGDGTVASIGVFEDQAAAAESNKKAADWIKENIAPLIPNPLQITVGEVRIHKTALLDWRDRKCAL